MEVNLTQTANEDNNVPTNDNETLTVLLGNICDNDGTFKYPLGFDGFLNEYDSTNEKTHNCEKSNTATEPVQTVKNSPTRKKNKVVELFVSPPKTPPTLKKVKKAQKVKNTSEEWIIRNPLDYEKDPIVLNKIILGLRRSPIFFRHPRIESHQYSNVSKEDSVYSKDQKFRMRSIDQIEFLFRLGASYSYYLKSHGYLTYIDELLDRLNTCVYLQTKSSFLNTKITDRSILLKIINIECEDILQECITLILGLYKLQEKSSLFQQVRNDLTNSCWLEVPSDYAKYIGKYVNINPFHNSQSLNKTSLF